MESLFAGNLLWRTRCSHLWRRRRARFPFIVLLRDLVFSRFSDGRREEIVSEGFSFVGRQSLEAANWFSVPLWSLFLHYTRHIRTSRGSRHVRMLAFPAEVGGEWWAFLLDLGLREVSCGIEGVAKRCEGRWAPQVEVFFKKAFTMSVVERRLPWARQVLEHEVRAAIIQLRLFKTHRQC